MDFLFLLIDEFLVTGKEIGGNLQRGYGLKIFVICALMSVLTNLIQLFLTRGERVEQIIGDLIEQFLKIFLIAALYVNFAYIFETSIAWMDSVGRVAIGSEANDNPHFIFIDIIEQLFGSIYVIFNAIYEQAINTATVDEKMPWLKKTIFFVTNAVAALFAAITKSAIVIIYVVFLLLTVITIILEYVKIIIAELAVYVLLWICIPLGVFTNAPFINSIFYSFLRLAVYVIIARFMLFVMAIPVKIINTELIKRISEGSSARSILEPDVISITDTGILIILMLIIKLAFESASSIAAAITGGGFGSSTYIGSGRAAASGGRSIGNRTKQFLRGGASK